MKWSEFSAKIDTFLTVDSDRQGSEAYVGLMKLQAAAELQHAIPSYTKRHEAVYSFSDTVEEGEACIITLPPQPFKTTEITERIQLEDGTWSTRGGRDQGWEARTSMINGTLAVNAGNCAFAVAPEGDRAYVYPKITEDDLISIFYTGIKTEFNDDEDTPFDDEAALACAEFVKAKMAREVDNDLNLHQSYMQSFARKKAQLYVNRKNPTL